MHYALALHSHWCGCGEKTDRWFDWWDSNGCTKWIWSECHIWICETANRIQV